MQIKATVKGAWYAFRSAVTGRFVSPDDAAKHPRTTVRESRGEREKRRTQ